MSYKTGYKFKISSTRSAEGKEIRQKIFKDRFSTRQASDLGVELLNSTLVEVLLYEEGAVLVKTLDLEGWLG